MNQILKTSLRKQCINDQQYIIQGIFQAEISEGINISKKCNLLLKFHTKSKAGKKCQMTVQWFEINNHNENSQYPFRIDKKQKITIGKDTQKLSINEDQKCVSLTLKTSTTIDLYPVGHSKMPMEKVMLLFLVKDRILDQLESFDKKDIVNRAMSDCKISFKDSISDINQNSMPTSSFDLSKEQLANDLSLVKNTQQLKISHDYSLEQSQLICDQFWNKYEISEFSEGSINSEIKLNQKNLEQSRREDKYQSSQMKSNQKSFYSKVNLSMEILELPTDFVLQNDKTHL